jgi:hypothetical protein
MHERTIVHCTEHSQCVEGEHDHGRRVAGSGNAGSKLECRVGRRGHNEVSSHESGEPPAKLGAKLWSTVEGGKGAGGLKRTLDAAWIEGAAKQATHPSRARAVASVKLQQAALAGWVQSEVAAAQRLNDVTKMTNAMLLAAQAVIASIPAAPRGALPPAVEANLSAFLLAVSAVHTRASAGAEEHVVRGHAAVAAARDAGAAAEHEVDSAMDDISQLLVIAMTAVANSPPDVTDAVTNAASMAVDEPEWLREAAEAIGVATEPAAAPAADLPTTPPATGQGAAASVLLQRRWRSVLVRRGTLARAEAARAAADATADAALEGRKRAARERLALREAEERAKRETVAAACASRRKLWQLRDRTVGAPRAEDAGATRVAEAPCGAAQSYIVPAAPGQTRLYSTVRRSAAATVMQAAWRRCVWRRVVRNTRWAGLVAEADAEAATRYAAREEMAAAVQQRVATVRAFRQLEADLREQGIRVAGGAASGGRQRARLREQRRREGIAERLWQRQRTMGM